MAAGVLVNRDAHILVTNAHREVTSLEKRVTLEQLRRALSPLATRPELIVVFHNAPFDVAMLERAGIPVNCQIHDTQKLLKLLDPDRGPEQDDGHGTGSHLPRFERRYEQPLNYKLKSVANHQLDIEPLDYPGNMVALPLPRLVRYLKSDLIVTRELYEFLMQHLQPDDLDYANRLIAPLAPLLIRMSLTGAHADKSFIQTESQRILGLMEDVSEKHFTEFGQRLSGR